MNDYATTVPNKVKKLRVHDDSLCEYCDGEEVVTNEHFNPVDGYRTSEQACICTIEPISEPEVEITRYAKTPLMIMNDEMGKMLKTPAMDMVWVGSHILSTTKPTMSIYG